MSKTFRRYEPDQMLLMPVVLQEWLPADHLAYFISDVVDHVDLKEILSRYEGEERGYPPRRWTCTPPTLPLPESGSCRFLR